MNGRRDSATVSSVTTYGHAGSSTEQEIAVLKLEDEVGYVTIHFAESNGTHFTMKISEVG